MKRSDTRTDPRPRRSGVPPPSSPSVSPAPHSPSSANEAPPPRRLILRCDLSVTDAVLLTAAVRDLHRCYPGRFLTDVRTPYPELWEQNPYLTPLDDNDPAATTWVCANPLLRHANRLPYHSLHGFIEFLNRRLRLAIQPTAFRGDIRLSREEKSWFSQVRELAGREIPFWLITSGGTYDQSVGWWDPARYQQVVQHFRDRVQFVQVGGNDEHHPRLEGVIDLRGQTDLRQLIRLVYHAQGILGPTGLLMHLAAAVETKPHAPGNRPCVVVAGAREPAHWLAYPDHQYFHYNGALPCSRHGGCWRERATPLGDGDPRDEPNRLCVALERGFPRCMSLIAAGEVMRRLDWFFQGGAAAYLTPAEARAARRAAAATSGNPFDRRTLNLSSVRSACERFLDQAPDYPEGYRGRGIVSCVSERYFAAAWVCVRLLRRLGCRLPVEFWYLGPRELDRSMRDLVAPFGVRCVDAFSRRRRSPARILRGWELKAYAVRHSAFEQVLFLDADNVPVRNPEFLFATPQFQSTGAIFWPDYGRADKADPVWRALQTPRPAGPEFESGQFLIDKRRCWRALCLAQWINENSDFFYRFMHGDKETFHLAFRRVNQPFTMIETPIHSLRATMCQHDFAGQRLFQHRNMDKWDLLLNNLTVPGFRFEEECRRYVRELQKRWDGAARPPRALSAVPRPAAALLPRRAPTVRACLLSCPERTAIRERTLRNLAATDWGEPLSLVHLDTGVSNDRTQRQTEAARQLLEKSLDLAADYILFLEDDLDFNRHLRHNLDRWLPLRRREVTLGGLYNPGLISLSCSVRHHYRAVSPHCVFGSQAFLLSQRTVRYVLRHWGDVAGMQDIRLSRLAGALRRPLYYHAPSLVQHRGRQSLWGGWFHQALDFDPAWRAE